jgi:FMN-dependent NADH-azoreductase
MPLQDNVQLSDELDKINQRWENFDLYSASSSYSRQFAGTIKTGLRKDKLEAFGVNSMQIPHFDAAFMKAPYYKEIHLPILH